MTNPRLRPCAALKAAILLDEVSAPLGSGGRPGAGRKTGTFKILGSKSTSSIDPVNFSSRQSGFCMPIILVHRVSLSDGHFKVASAAPKVL